MPFSDNPRYYLREKKMTQMAVAKKVNRKHCTVFRWLTGETVPRLPVVMVVANVLGVCVNDLLDKEKRA